jgi:hypothetical protein
VYANPLPLEIENSILIELISEQAFFISQHPTNNISGGKSSKTSFW